jgi:hypothetical protein
MAKLLYLLIAVMMAINVNSFAQEPKEVCPEGQNYDTDLTICVDAPTEVQEQEVDIPK